MSRWLRDWIGPTGVLALALLLGTTDLAAQMLNEGFIISREARPRYNRVEGFYGGYRVSVTPRRYPGFTPYVDAGYGVDSEAFRWEIGVDHTTRTWSVGASVYDRTASNDDTTVRTGENTLFMPPFKGDYRDYYRAKHGVDLDGEVEVQRNVRLLGSLQAFTYEPMAVRASWSLFRGGDSIRANPLVRPGDAGILRVGVVYDSRRLRSPIFRNAWHLGLVYERGFREFPYNGVSLSVTRYQKLVFGRQAFVARATLASRGSTEEQHLFDIGGIGTLRGYRIKEYTGNRLLLLNVDYHFNGDIIGRIPVKGAHLFELSLFADAGWTELQPRSASVFEGFSTFETNDVKTNLGAALSIYRQLVRFNVARRFDSDIDDWTFSVRVKYRL